MFAVSIFDASFMEDNLHKVIMFIIDQTSKAAKQYSQREFDHLGLGITVDQWVLLKIIEQFDGLSQTDLAKKSIRDPASITRTLDLLQKKGLVQRNPLPDNRRQYSINLTPEGNSFVQKHMDMVHRHRARSIEGFTEDELQQLKAMLLRIQENMR